MVPKLVNTIISPRQVSRDLCHTCLGSLLWPVILSGLFGSSPPELETDFLPVSPPTGFLCLRSENLLVFAVGIAVLGVCHYTLTVKGSHLATHNALSESKFWNNILALFFVEVSVYVCVLQEGCGETATGTTRVRSLFCASVQVCTTVCM